MIEFSFNERTISELGYYVDKDGTCFSKSGKILKGTISKAGYIIISTRIDGKTIKIGVHRLQAFQKYGEKIYADGVKVRHADNYSLNNSWENILIGSHQDNMLDIPKEIRLNSAIVASNNRKIYSDELVKEIKVYRELGHTYPEIMSKFNVGSKGAVSYIINKRL